MAGAFRNANPSTIQDKVLVGYQGWFTCPGDGEPIGPGHHGWLHWFNSPMPSGGRPNIDIWPDISGYDPSELYPAPGLTTSSGDPVYLFSSRHPKTVRRHFHHMALHGVDGAFLQRFAGQCEIKSGNLGIRNLRDEIGERVREAAEAEGRVFAIMYDVSGVSPDKIQNILEQDWIHLLHEQRVLDSPNYLHEQGRPVVALWGFGLNGRNHTIDLVRAITAFFRSSIPGGVYLMAGTPGHWRTSSSDADRNPAFLQVWSECFDAISPWTIGRYGNEEEADRWGEERVKADAEYLKRLEAEGRRKVDYIPVVFPGGSGFNLSEGKWGMNDIPRKGGQFLWRQIYNARRAGVRTIYCAMWDEYDEGTALMPVVSHSSQLPVHPSFRFVALDVDGYELPPDWYMRIAGFAAEAFHGERTLQDTFPVKELQDYWSTRPRYEGGKAEGRKQWDDVDRVTRALREWEISDVSNEAPPPYSLEDTSAEQGRTSNAGGRPPGSYQSHSSPSHSSFSIAAGATAVTLGAAAVAHTLSGGSARSSLSASPLCRTSHPSTATLPPPVDKSSHPSSPLPPSVFMSSRPSSTTPYRSPTETVMSPPLPPRRPSTASDSSWPTHGHRTTHFPGPGVSEYRPAYPGRAPSLGQSTFPVQVPNSATAFPSAMGPPVPVEFERGRSRSRSRSRSHSRSHSRKHKHGKHKARRSRSRSSSSRRPPMQDYAPHAHGHHGHDHSPSYGHGHGVGFPGAPGGLYHAHSEGGVYGPGHSMPVGPAGPLGHSMSAGSAYAPGHGHGQGMYTGPYPTQCGPGYDPNGMQGHGYVPHPSSSPYYAPYGPGAAGPSYGGPAGAGGSGTGFAGNIASALQVVEGIAGKQTRRQLEKKVKTLTNSGSTLFNKFK